MAAAMAANITYVITPAISSDIIFPCMVDDNFKACQFQCDSERDILLTTCHNGINHGVKHPARVVVIVFGYLLRFHVSPIAFSYVNDKSS